MNYTNNVATGRSPNTYSPYDSNGNATSYYNSSYQTGKISSPDAPRIEELNEQQAYYCSIADRVPNIQAFGAGDYSGISAAISIYQSYRNGSQVSSLNNLGMAFVNIIGALESVRGDDKTPIATALYNRINKSIRELEANSNDNVAYNAGRVGKDIESLIFDLFLLKEVGSEKLLENPGLIAKAGEVLVAISESSGALEAVVGLAAAGNAVWNSSNLGNDLNDLVNAIKGDDYTSHNVPNYVNENRVPTDKETVLAGNEYKRTNITNKGARVYEKDGMYYCRDTFHTGESAHLEVFDRFGNHVGEANPVTGEIISGTADAAKHLYIR